MLRSYFSIKNERWFEETKMNSEDYINIKEVCQITGVAAVTLRAWERRYGLIKPKRTAKGHRLYSKGNIEEIRQIISWLNRGVAISKVSALLSATATHNEVPPSEKRWQEVQQELLSTLIELRQKSLDPLLDKLNKSIPFASLCENVYQPFLEQLLVRWHSKPLGYQLEQQLWQQSWQRQIMIMTLRMNKQKPQANCWLVNIDKQYPSVDYWLFYGLFLQSGIHVDAINKLDDLSVLPRLKKSLDQPLIIFGNHKITPIEIHHLVKTEALWHQDMLVVGRVADIHQDTLSERGIKHVGADVAACWQSACYRSWIAGIESNNEH